MFGWNRKKTLRGNKGNLKLGIGDRDTIKMTKDSNQLAREMLEIAREEAKDLAPGETVTIQVTEDHPEIHHLELMFSFMTLAPEYGLQAGVQFNNSQTFEKI